MIYLITGLPGNGKTLYTLWHVKERAEKEGRAVFYNGITDCKIESWSEFQELEKWHELPKGAIIIIDECQRIFPAKGGRPGESPKYIEELHTHRHHGFDLYLITQHPSLVDNRVRKLAGTHRHIHRTFGTQRAVINEWGEVHDDCHKNRKTASKTNFVFPKQVYGLYKSAEMHTHKVQLPKQVYYLGIALVLLLVCGYFVYSTLEKARTPGALIDRPHDVSSDGGASTMVLSSGGPGDERPLTAEEYIATLIPRIPNVPHTASRYDEVAKPVEVPFVAGCVSFKGQCQCYTQRGTRTHVDHDYCESVVETGTPFYDFVSSGGGQAGQIQSQLPQPPAGSGVSLEPASVRGGAISWSGRRPHGLD